jgi:DNA-binding transcriptional MocR family regulator
MRFPNHKTEILVEQPTYNGIVNLLKMNHIPVVGIERNFKGIDLAELERIFTTHEIKCFYTNPRFHHPLGTSLSRDEKKQILKLAYQYDVYVIEDDYLADLEIKKNSYPMYYDDINARVIYIKSFSKTLLPGLRIAAVVVPELLVNEFEKYKKWLDLGTAVLSQGALEIYIKCGMFHTHRKKIKKIYAEKMNLVSNRLKAAQSPKFQCHVPDTGFFACIEFRDDVNIDKLMQTLDEKKIMINPINENYIDAYRIV